tara:strand:- start:6530 stop:6925 length:396 start_codon:yes stop_codon:yes gene_type:complete
MKETYINITDECDAIDELCIICFEIEDGYKKKTITHSKLLKCTCKCNYYIHKSCFDKWLEKNPKKNVSCLICSSTATQVLSCKEKVGKIIKSKKIIICFKDICKFSLWVCCFLLVWIIISEYENINNNYDE